MLTSTQCEVVAAQADGGYFCPEHAPEGSEPIIRYTLDEIESERAYAEYEVLTPSLDDPYAGDGPDWDGPHVIVRRDDGEIRHRLATLREAESLVYELVREHCEECDRELG